MKLYFYILKEPYNGKPFIQFEECEVDEKPKTYTLITRPKGYCYSRVSKNDIGAKIDNVIFLLERNDSLVRSIFSKSINGAISIKEKQLEWLREQLEAVEKGEIQ